MVFSTFLLLLIQLPMLISTAFCFRNRAVYTATVVFLIVQFGCKSATAPSEESQQMIPSSSNNQWEYVVYGIDSTGNKSSEAGSRTLSLFQNWQFPVYQWDSTSKIWLQSSAQTNQFVGSEYDTWDNFESFDDNFIFAPYSNGSENGLICGDIFEGTLGGRFWFFLPDHPSMPLSYHAILSLPYNETINDTVIYSAFFDTTQYAITVPAGNFKCYKLVFRYDGQLGDISINPDSLIAVDTMYLTPGKGVIKRVISRVQQLQFIPDTVAWAQPRPVEDYELSSYQIQ